MKLGLIGISEGNGHPYSWSAIINGFDEKKIEECEFDTIPKYLKKNSCDVAQIKNVRISHIWTQSSLETKKIAQSTFIRHQCKHWNEMVDKVDGILLARDDSENHIRYAEIYLRKGIPIYIDKPIATSIAKAKEIYDLEMYPGQIFTCSALRYADEFNLDEETRKELGTIKSVEATSIKEWDKYAIHIIEPSYNIANPKGKILRQDLRINGKNTSLELVYSNVKMKFETTGKKTGEIRIKIIGSRKTIIRKFEDPFQAFKKSLETFVSGIQQKRQMISKDEVINVVEIIELGKKQIESQRDQDNSRDEYL